MGYGSYSHAAHEAITSSRAHTPREQVFTQRSCHATMNPHGVRFRESRDSDAHPNSLAIAFALDVTGSMAEIPEMLARRELPGFMKLLTDGGIADPQVMFTAFGDATCDRAALQVGQFESAAKEMDDCLTHAYLEQGGGPGGCESYELALYFLARHTAMDCFEKRGKKGYIFMTGDEHPYPRVSAAQVKSLIGDDLDQDLPVEDVIAEANRTFETFFLIPDHGRASRVQERWRGLLGDHVICLERAEDTCRAAAGIAQIMEGAVADLSALEERMLAAGTTASRASAVVASIKPFISSLNRRHGRRAGH